MMSGTPRREAAAARPQGLVAVLLRPRLPPPQLDLGGGDHAMRITVREGHFTTGLSCRTPLPTSGNDQKARGWLAGQTGHALPRP